MRLAATALVVFALGLSPAVASDLFDACADAAANRYEPGYEGVGPLDVGGFAAYDAIDACSQALAENPSDVRLQAWLGNAYAADGQGAKALPLLETAAAAGNVVALRALGDLLIVGKGVPGDKQRGSALLQQAAEAGFVPAELSLGYSYDFGDGVSPDPATAFKWYLAAASGGAAKAQLIV
eukprot:gene6593-8915_t